MAGISGGCEKGMMKGWQKDVEHSVVQPSVAGCINNRQKVFRESKIPQRILFGTYCLIPALLGFVCFFFFLSKYMCRVSEAQLLFFLPVLSMCCIAQRGPGWGTTAECVPWETRGPVPLLWAHSGTRVTSAVSHCPRKPWHTGHGCSVGSPESRIGRIVVTVLIVSNV